MTHHSVLFTRRRQAVAAQSGFFDVLGVWAVGTPPTVYPEGMGRWIRKGQQLRTNLHYHPNGKAADRSNARRSLLRQGRAEEGSGVGGRGRHRVPIPPGAKNHEMRARLRRRSGHQRRVVLPAHALARQGHDADGDVTRWRQADAAQRARLRLQLAAFYYPKERVALPRGTRVEAVAHYDNSADNPNNPDPTRAVTFGEQSTDEMMFGVFEFTPKDGVSPHADHDRQAHGRARERRCRRTRRIRRSGHDAEADPRRAAHAPHRRRHVVSRAGPLPDQRDPDQATSCGTATTSRSGWTCGSARRRRSRSM